MSPGNFVRKILFQSVKHRVTPLTIDLPDQFHVLIEKAVAGNFVRDELVEGGSVKVGCLLELHELADDIFGRNHPCEANSGRQSFREGAQVNDIAQCESIVAA